MNMRSSRKRNSVEMALRRRLFDKRHYRHIGYYICDDPDVPLETDTVKGIKKLLECCMLLPFMQYDRKRGAFLWAEIIAENRDTLVLEVRTYERYDTGFAENMEYYDLHPSDSIFSDIDHAVNLEWTALLNRLGQSEEVQ